jgi:hypothetical protein
VDGTKRPDPQRYSSDEFVKQFLVALSKHAPNSKAGAIVSLFQNHTALSHQDQEQS